MATNLNASYLGRRAVAIESHDAADRWPPFFAFCFAAGSSATLWLSIAQLIRLM